MLQNWKQQEIIIIIIIIVIIIITIIIMREMESFFNVKEGGNHCLSVLISYPSIYFEILSL
jgi:hypothetical protein